MKKTLFVLGTILIGLEFILYIHWYKELYFMEFFFLIGFCHLSITAIFFGILTEFLPKEKRKLIINLSFCVFGLIIPLILYNSYRIQNKIDNEGILKSGIVEKKERGSKSVRWLESKFNYNGIDYNSNFHMEIEDFDKVNIKDTVLIKFIPEYPKLNRTEKLINK
ncbi:hypothetical protein [Kordia sp.]|uniref:hypothetical protein n=1 Tax=Kordia sp. TaxID=1965332 RepID=UPI003D6B150E